MMNIEPSFVPAINSLFYLQSYKQSTTDAGISNYQAFYPLASFTVLLNDIGYFYGSDLFHTTIVPFDAPVYTF